MTPLVIAIHIIVCLALIMIVLLQTGKGADMGAAFGAGSSQTLFGSAGPGGFLTKATTGAAIVFMLTSLGLAYLSGPGRTSSVMTDIPRAEQPAAPADLPATPATEAPAADAPAAPMAEAPAAPMAEAADAAPVADAAPAAEAGQGEAQ